MGQSSNYLNSLLDKESEYCQGTIIYQIRIVQPRSRVSHLPTPGGGKIRDTGNEVGILW